LCTYQDCTISGERFLERELVTGNEIPRIVALGCIMEASIGKHIVQTIEAPRSPGHRSSIGSVVHIGA
jgi:hypothetical protein